MSETKVTKKTSRMRGRFNNAKKLDNAVDFVKNTTADQKFTDSSKPTPPLRMGAPPSVGGFSETFVTSIFSQAIVKMDTTDDTPETETDNNKNSKIKNKKDNQDKKDIQDNQDKQDNKK